MASDSKLDEMLGVFRHLLKATTGKGIDEMMEEFEEVSLEALAASITANIEQEAVKGLGKKKVTFMLMEPLLLTVRRDKGYSKRPHIGSEEFIPSHCYAGKKGKLIYVFKSVGPADYLEMEIEEAEAKRSLQNFEPWLKTVVDSEMERNRREASDRASVEAEREKLAARSEYVELGYGSW